MQTYLCTCGNRIYFENSLCLACQREVGWCEACARMTALERVRQQTHSTNQPALVVDYRCSHPDCGKPLRKCSNYAIENICNRCYVADSDRASSNGAAGPTDAPINRLCNACQLTETIPDLSVAGNREKWARLEAAKRRLLSPLDRLGLPYFNAEPRLTFDFKADVERSNNEWRSAGPVEVVYTGHAGGKITINIREADDAIREQLRVQFLEAQ